ncbi:MAG: hypothetical protein ACE5EY_01555 [Anaerolineae bacterium]
MKQWFTSLNGAITLSVLALLSEAWRGFLDAMFVFPTDIADETLMNLAAVIFTLLFGGWTWSLVAASRGSRRGLIAAFALNLLVLLAIPVSCPGWEYAETKHPIRHNHDKHTTLFKRFIFFLPNSKSSFVKDISRVQLLSTKL